PADARSSAGRSDARVLGGHRRTRVPRSDRTPWSIPAHPAWARPSLGPAVDVSRSEAPDAPRPGAGLRRDLAAGRSLAHLVRRPGRGDARAPDRARDGLIRQGFVACGIEFVERALKVSAAPGRLHERILDVAEALADRGQFVFARRYSTLASRSSHPGIAVRARTLDVRNEFV